MAAAIGAHQAGVKSVLVIDRLPYLGGILPQCSHEGFGMRLLGRELTGIEYSQWLVDRFNRLKIPTLLSSSVLSISKQRCIALNTPTGRRQIQAKAIILASGCRERTLASLPNISGTRPAGVLTAGSAQKMVNIAHWELGEKIVILGSGDVGMIMARQFVLQGKQVLAVLEQADKLGGLKRNKQRCLDAHNIPLITNATVSELHGTGRLTGISIVSKGDKSGQGNSPSTVPTLVAEPTLVHNHPPASPFGSPTIPAFIAGSIASEVGPAINAGTELLSAGAASTDPGSYFIPCDTLVTSIGLVPELELLHGLQNTLDADKSIAPNSDFLGNQKINIPWLFLAGNAKEVQAFVDNVVDDGNLTGTTAARYLKTLKKR
ncbi:hypothetical protein FACS1894104_5830 [Actinomycetota bacterium]|nr:hypothetical protein FACS1894104_5830 [Actinomycetota bacterium]